MVIKQKEELLAPGHSTCAGCGEVLGVRMLLRELGPKTVVCLATGCIEITSTAYPTTAWKIPLIHATFENAAAVASGVKRALEKQGKHDTQVVALGGDGGMADIGFQAISGALERYEDIIIVCTDNECYSNTGVQRSGMTPMFASTTTTPAGSKLSGKAEWKKPLAIICAAHQIPYVATASVAFPADLANKVKKAMSIKGPRFLHIHVPCPPGWKFNSDSTIDIGKLAVETGMWALYEIEDGKFKMTYKPAQLKPVADYIKPQGRFKHLSDKQVAELQEQAKKHYDKLLAFEKCGTLF